MDKKFEDFEIQVLLSHEYDQNNAILEIHPGAGGTESCDWASMLYRMYTRYAEKHGFKVSVLDYLPGDEAGIKSVTFLVEGDKAYGYLKSEKGVHRLVRISPFDSGARRHTSFASLDVMPQFNDEISSHLCDSNNSKRCTLPDASINSEKVIGYIFNRSTFPTGKPVPP